MSSRVAGFVVTLDRDVKDEDRDAVLTALRMVKGVLSVKPVEASCDLHIAQERASREWQQKIADLLWPKAAK